MYLGGGFRSLYYGLVSVLVYSMITIPLMSVAVALKLAYLRCYLNFATKRQDKRLRATVMVLFFAFFYLKPIDYDSKFITNTKTLYMDLKH